MRPIISSQKHYVQHSLETVAASAIVSKVIAEAVAIDAQNTVSEVREGAIVKAVYVESWLGVNAAAIGSFIYIVYKTQGGQIPPTTTEMAALGDFDNKRNILFTSQGLVNMNSGNATPVIRTWVKIPKGKQRMALGDKLRISIFAQGAQPVNHCGFNTYKEYT